MKRKDIPRCEVGKEGVVNMGDRKQGGIERAVRANCAGRVGF